MRAVTLGFLALCLSLSLARGQYNVPSFAGNRTTVVHLFEWKWTDIAAECERFLGPEGYAGVQVSPPNENAVINEPPRPWWERYQPVSYKLETRSGTEEQFKDMVRRCNAVGVRIIVDAVINHMTHYTTVGVGTGGSSFDSNSKTYPGVPYTNDEFHGPECPTASGDIENHLSAFESRVCQVGGLRDLNQNKASVRQKITEYMDRLVSYGVAGFRIDCGKQILPEDMKAIFDAIRNLPTEQGFPANTRPFVFHEVIILDSDAEEIKASEYFGIGRATEFKYSLRIGDTVRKNAGRTLKSLFNFGEPVEGMHPSEYAMIFTDNHDNQRGHGAGGGSVVSHREPKMYKVANAFMLAWPYGQVKVMSSYAWSGNDADSWVGPPNTNGNIDSPIITPTQTCEGGWICEHRWRQIKHMAQFRNIVQGTDVREKWDNGNNQIAFCRGDKGFIVINNEGTDMNVNLQTCLPPGTYCDIITGDVVDGKCTGREIRVALGGKADFFIPGNDEELVTAIHVQAMATL